MRRILALLFVLWASVAEAQIIFPPGPSGGGVPVGGSCSTANALGKFTVSTTLGCSLTTDDGTNVSQASGEHRLFGSSTLFTGASTNSSGAYLLTQSTVKPNAPTAALAGAGAGNVDNGTHVYCVTFITASGETECSTSSASVNVVDKTVNGKVTVTFTVSAFTSVTGRNVYRSKANTATPLFLVATSPVVNNNSATTYTDNIADASLTATQSPSTNTTNDARLTVGNTGALTGPSNVLAVQSGTTQQRLQVWGPSSRYVELTYDGSQGLINTSVGPLLMNPTTTVNFNAHAQFGGNAVLGGATVGGAQDARLYRSTTKTWTLDDTAGGALTLVKVIGPIGFYSTNSTAAVAGVIGNTCPAITCTAAYTWVQAQSSDGSTVWFPVWK